MTDQASGTAATGNEGGAQAAQPVTTSTGAAAPTVDYAAEIARRDSEIASLRKESASSRVAKNEARTTAEKLAEEQGQFKALAESYKARIAELEPYEGPAKSWAAHEKRELERVTAARAQLAPEAQAALDAVPTLEGKLAVLNVLSKGAPMQRPAPEKPPIPGGAPPAPNGTDWTSFSSEAELKAAKQRDPAGWKQFLESQGSGARSLTYIERMQQRTQKTAAG